ncbi:MAG: hypothetical protein A2511_01180 [Deltaproteobacteria bacterium RIFOXYD12_FULL_50_9]|nr:MAG: hypothetical protein A2511_01180 [Deltaproteobacteria bacterium RIFOXYD12_FULL_50_9]
MKLNTVITVMVLALYSAAGTCFADQPGRLIVTFKKGVKATALPALARAHGLEVIHQLGIIHGLAVQTPLVAKANQDLLADPHVERVEEDAPMSAMGKSSKPSPTPPPIQEIPWGIHKIGADSVWNMTSGNGIKVAVLDTGIQTNHSDLATNYKGGVNIQNSRKGPEDDNGHGTWCAGIIAAVDNTIGVVGVAPRASLYAVKVLDRNGSGYTSDVIAGIEWSVTQGMDVISMSLGSNSDVQALREACALAYDAGLVLVAAAGNDGDGDLATDNVDYPGAYDSVIAVAATDSLDLHPSWSSDGSTVEISAPGAQIRSTYKGSTYATGDGTSAACPHVSGSVALLLGLDPALSPYDVRTRLVNTATDLGEADWDPFFGAGLLNLPAATSGL